MAQRNAGTQYMMLAQTLLKQIRGGQYPAGALLPTESALCQQFGVSRITVRGALRELETQGIVSRRAGVGTRVESASPGSTFVHVGNTVDEILRFTKGFRFQTLTVNDVVFDAAQARTLQAEPGQAFTRVTGVRRAQDGAPPVVYSEHHIPTMYAGPADRLDGYSASIAELLADERGDRVTEIRQSIDAVRLTRAQARLLETPASSPTLRTRTWYYGTQKNLIVASIGLFPEGRHLFTTVMRREPAG